MPNHPPPENAEERRARELAETVKQEASGVSETVREEAGGVTEQAEERAADRVIQRAEERLEERIESRADIKGELIDITAAIGTLVEHMDRSLPEERVAAILNGAKEEEKRSRRRLAVGILGPLLIVGAIAAGSWSQARANNKQNDDIAVVADYVRNCLQHPEDLTPAEKVEQCGADNDGTVRLVRGLLNSINCSLLISPETRTEANTDACAARAFGP